MSIFNNSKYSLKNHEKLLLLVMCVSCIITDSYCNIFHYFSEVYLVDLRQIADLYKIPEKKTKKKKNKFFVNLEKMMQ